METVLTPSVGEEVPVPRETLTGTDAEVTTSMSMEAT